jgi:hypothetical protein
MTMDVEKRSGLLASTCLLREPQTATRADRLRDQVHGMTVSVNQFRDERQNQLERASA